MIVSLIDGRIRIRDIRLRGDIFSTALKERLLAQRGITEVLINCKVGSLLVFYNTAEVNTTEIINILSNYLDIADNPKTSRARSKIRKVSISKQRIIKIGMLSSLALNLIAAVLDAKALHITAGIIFLGFLGSHLIKRRRLIFR